MAPSSLFTVISSGLGGGGVAKARFFAASSSGDKVAVGLAVAVGALVVVGAPVPLALPLPLAVAFGVLVCAVATAPLALPELEERVKGQNVCPESRIFTD